MSDSSPLSPPQDNNAVTRLPFGFAKRHQVLLRGGDAPALLCTQLPAPNIVAEAQRVTGQLLNCELLPTEEFQKQLRLAYERDSSEAMQMVEDLGELTDLTSLANAVPETGDLLEQEDDAPIIRLINALLAEAIRQNASDIHIETFEKRLLVRFRVDGVLREVVQPKRELAPLLVSRIKVMSRLDIAEKRVPQDGRISLRMGGREVDVRVSTLPSSNGERVVMRLLDKQAGRLTLDNLGMQPDERRRFETLLHRPHGIILVTGPTGSGKTTSLYAGLSSINQQDKNILTVEDPIEYNLEGIGQTQVNTKADLTFARGLRAMLRQDPDVVMVGEIRDLETAEIAIQASLTGHLVLSTLHTNTAIGAVTRLTEMGVEPFLLSSSLIGVIAQRLVRLLCPHCKTPYQADAAECELLRVDNAATPPTLYHAAGCEHCNQQGYLGRTGIYEVIAVNDNLRALIHQRAPEAELITLARQRSPGIRDDGRARILAGDTTVEEVLRVTHED
ncbi:type II secretion system ATPase GspE [Pseudomaricurvus sp. HS19]|uniref:type II secretion system ATPase GspE n=1 Tax=Pseudomaricurvus sp. HS19 TaxID=2692626 RepID=UPI00136A1661|nr:type II secretion system ATPase GspE [Pseudomaricurvus sp. HS19]MYM62965.1 type II secretion system ATPase GspE [Pseudomaricurvus sp. HS19]